MKLFIQQKNEIASIYFLLCQPRAFQVFPHMNYSSFSSYLSRVTEASLDRRGFRSSSWLFFLVWRVRPLSRISAKCHHVMFFHERGGNFLQSTPGETFLQSIVGSYREQDEASRLRPFRFRLSSASSRKPSTGLSLCSSFAFASISLVHHNSYPSNV